MGNDFSAEEKQKSVLMQAAAQAIAKLGGPSKVARKLQILPWAVSKWRLSRVPAERVPQILQAFPGQVSAHELRPDLYPVDIDTKP